MRGLVRFAFREVQIIGYLLVSVPLFLIFHLGMQEVVVESPPPWWICAIVAGVIGFIIFDTVKEMHEPLPSKEQ